METFPCGGCQRITGWVGAVGGVLEGDAVGGDGLDGGVALGGGLAGVLTAFGLGGEVDAVLLDGGIQGGGLGGSDAGEIVGLGFGAEGAGVSEEGFRVWVESFADEVAFGVEVGLRVVVGGVHALLLFGGFLQVAQQVGEEFAGFGDFGGFFLAPLLLGGDLGDFAVGGADFACEGREPGIRDADFGEGGLVVRLLGGGEDLGGGFQLFQLLLVIGALSLFLLRGFAAVISGRWRRCGCVWHK